MARKKPALNESDRRFIEDIAVLLEPAGMPRSYGRFYAYLLLCTEPATLEQIADDLQISRSSAWNAARELGGYGHIRRQTDIGSKRALYSQSEVYGAPILKSMSNLAAMATLLRERAAKMPSDALKERLLRRASFYVAICEIVEKAVEDLTGGVPAFQPEELDELPTEVEDRS